MWSDNYVSWVLRNEVSGFDANRPQQKCRQMAGVGGGLSRVFGGRTVGSLADLVDTGNGGGACILFGTAMGRTLVVVFLAVPLAFALIPTLPPAALAAAARFAG